MYWCINSYVREWRNRGFDQFGAHSLTILFKQNGLRNIKENCHVLLMFYLRSTWFPLVLAAKYDKISRTSVSSSTSVHELLMFFLSTYRPLILDNWFQVLHKLSCNTWVATYLEQPHRIYQYESRSPSNNSWTWEKFTCRYDSNENQSQIIRIHSNLLKSWDFLCRSTETNVFH